MSTGVTSDRRFYGWTNVSITAIMGIAGGMYIVSFGMFLKPLVKEFGWKIGTASLAPTINMILMGICGPIAGSFIVKYGAKRALVLGNIVGCIGFTMLFLQSHLWELFVAQGILLGAGAGFGGLLASTTVLNNWFIKKRRLALSIFLGSGGLGGIVMGPLIMYLIDAIGWRHTYLVIALLVLVTSVVLPALFVKNRPQDLGQVPDGETEDAPAIKQAPNPRGGYKTPVDFTAKEAMRTASLWLLIIYFCLNMLAMQGLMTHLVTHMRDIGISSTKAGFALSIMSALMTAAQFLLGFVGTKYSVHTIAVAAEFLKLVGIILLVFTRTLPFIFASMVIMGFGFGAVFIATWNMFPDYFGISSYPKIMGNVRLAWAFVGALGAPIAGYVRDTTGSYMLAFQGVIVLIAVGLICLFFAKPPVHPSLKKAQPVLESSSIGVLE
jgi:MFS family permease